MPFSTDGIAKLTESAFFVANEYIRAMGMPGLADGGKVGSAYEGVADIAQRHMDAAAGKLDIQGLVGKQDSS